MRFGLLLCFITFTSLISFADKMPLLTDSTVTTTAEILSRIQSNAMTALKAKYSDLQKNFTPDFLTSGLDLDCRTGAKAVGDGVMYAGVRFSNESKVTSTGLVQSYSSISHFDCYGRLIFTERIKVLGVTPAVITLSNAVKFVRNFEVLPTETARQYQVENAQSEIVLSINSQRISESSGERIYSNVEIGGAKWLTLDQLDPSLNERRIYLQVFTGVFKIGGSKFRLNFNGGSSVLKMLWTDRRIEHVFDGAVVNQVTFDATLDSNIISLTSEMISFFFARAIESFPQTTKVQVGVSDSPFLRELQLNYNRMLTNTEAEQVKVFFQKTIEGIKNGQIKVEQ